MIRVITKKDRGLIRAKVNSMGKKPENNAFYPEAMFIQIYNERRKKIQNYIIHKEQWIAMKKKMDESVLTPMEALLASKDISEEQRKFINTVAKLLSIWGYIDIKPFGFKKKVCAKENTLKDIYIMKKEETLETDVFLPYTLENLVKYLRDTKEIEVNE